MGNAKECKFGEDERGGRCPTQTEDSLDRFSERRWARWHPSRRLQRKQFKLRTKLWHVSRVSQTRDALTVFSAVRCDTSTILLEPSPSINFMKLDSSIRAPPPTRAIDRYPSRDLGLTHPLTTVPVKRLVRASFAGSLFLYPSEFPQPAGRPETQPPRHRISCRGFGRGRSCPSNLGCRHPQWAGDGCIETDA